MLFTLPVPAQFTGAGVLRPRQLTQRKPPAVRKPCLDLQPITRRPPGLAKGPPPCGLVIFNHTTLAEAITVGLTGDGRSPKRLGTV
jgi:hypothetical protein